MNQSKKIIVIGAGVAGLAAAARLAAQGFAVSVYERNATAGGKLGHLQQAGFSWDTGPSLFTQPQVLEDLFAACGKHPGDYLKYQQLQDGTRYFWDDGTRLTAFPEKEKLAAAIEHALPVQAAPVLEYLEHAATAYRHIGSIFLDRNIRDLRTWLQRPVLSALAAVRRGYLAGTLHDYNAEMLQHPKLVQLFDRFATYNGSDPYRCPAMLSMIAHLELNEGAYYPQGGMIAIPKALEQLCRELGVEFHFGTPADKIVHRHGRITGIETGGKFAGCTAAVSNADVYFTYRNLLNDAARAASIKKQERSSSGIVFYWGIRKKVDSLGLHNIFFSNDYAAEFSAIRAGIAFQDPTIYLNITACMEPAHAPEGCDNWFVLINAPAGTAVDAAFIAHTRKATLAKLSAVLREDVEGLIVTETVMGPEGIQAGTGSYMGALYGTAGNSKMAAFARHPNASKKYKGLFFAGGTVHPGGGIPLCLRSGKAAADAIAATGLLK